MHKTDGKLFCMAAPIPGAGLEWGSGWDGWRGGWRGCGKGGGITGSTKCSPLPNQGKKKESNDESENTKRHKNKISSATERSRSVGSIRLQKSWTNLNHNCVFTQVHAQLSGKLMLNKNSLQMVMNETTVTVCHRGIFK